MPSEGATTLNASAVTMSAPAARTVFMATLEKVIVYVDVVVGYGVVALGLGPGLMKNVFVLHKEFI